MSFTPGPWRLQSDHGGKRVDPDCNCIVADVEDTVHCEGHGYDEYCFIPNHADAVLMAAAPDLYEALKSIAEPDVLVEASDGAWALDALKFRQEQARAAIAKAEGRE